MTRSLRIGFAATIMTLAATGLQADVLELVDGSRIVGTIEQIDATQATLSNTFAGALTVPRSAIVGVETSAPVTVQLVDGAYLTGTVNTPEGGTPMVDVEAAGQRPIPLASISGVYREDPLTLQRRELAVKVSAQANVGVTLSSGNTTSENLHLDGQLVTRTKRNRYTLSGEYNKEESEKVLVKQNWNSLVKYDHFVSDKWYWFNSASFENDDFADLNLRSAIAAGIGYQFHESDTRSLSIELGPSYIDENYIVAEDDSYLGSRWAINYDQRLWDGLSFYHYNEGLMGLEDTDDLTIRSRTGLRMNVSERIIARIQTAIDWDKSPSEGTDSTDYEHSLTIGYRF